MIRKTNALKIKCIIIILIRNETRKRFLSRTDIARSTPSGFASRILINCIVLLFSRLERTTENNRSIPNNIKNTTHKVLFTYFFVFLNGFAGTPTTTSPTWTSCVTTAPAPVLASSAIFNGATNMVSLPIKTRSPITVGCFFSPS